MSRGFGKSADEVDKWTASFAGPGLPGCDIVVDTRSVVGKFRVELLPNSSTELGAVLANLSDPFDSTGEASPSGGLDRRVSMLTRLCRSLWEQSINEYAWYEATIELWRCIEEKTQFEISGA